MIIKVERITEDSFRKLLSFMCTTEIDVPDAFNVSNAQLIYGDSEGGKRKKIRPIDIRGEKYDLETGLYSFDIIISQLIKIDILECEGSSQAQKRGEVTREIKIPRCIIDGIFDILNIFPK